MAKPKLSEILRERGYVYQHTGEKLEEVVDKDPRTFYWGVDPSADSMHIGHLMGVVVLRRFVEAGHKLIVLVGGGTGMIGDPSGKSVERTFLSDDLVARNAEALRKQFKKLLGGVDFEMVNNAEWLHKLNLMEFLRDIGKHFTVNEMIKRDNIRPRLEDPDASISYTEFTYSLLQAYDFLHLHDKKKCDLQVGASDQWGNIVSGVDLIRRKTGKVAHAFTWPLLIDKKTGKKFGKSEGGAIWLDEKKTPFFDFYQFWVNASDDALREYMLRMTMMTEKEIDETMRTHDQNPSLRYGQNKLAYKVTEFVHGTDKADRAERVSRVLFGKDGMSRPVTETDWKLLCKDGDVPNLKVVVGARLLDVIVSSKLASSNREARQFLMDGAIALNYRPEKIDRSLSEIDFVNGYAFLQRGKRYVSVLILRK